ncbi:hypothetical protein OSH17_06700 [Acinetobacter baumannii]|uniref:hypothetical protein n=1 Tax=Acinetobacter baumannii TaxID=470 RepID=UPI00144A52B8|nr:hypothetical protein [Acinetobacter baumannii]MDC5408331.1 hypothetical protein [Acinetobacter baumannii]NLP54463.1 hypothetical protein [Acinetobacter baumannii]NQE75056.1 hypothetical protein [Acinetobacter baumannii]QNT89768.1 hypothetical protein H0N27_06670 [Acinetobacter baumannii]WEX32535.1 hypothetical protein OSH13_10875 [Acinetobacter baumannii]
MKFKVEVSNIYVKEHIVEADDLAHALEIASEISDSMEANQETFFESEWEAKPVSNDEKVTYEPQQEYLK